MKSEIANEIEKLLPWWRNTSLRKRYEFVEVQLAHGSVMDELSINDATTDEEREKELARAKILTQARALFRKATDDDLYGKRRHPSCPHCVCREWP
jgi:hypothetical protein